MPFEDLPSRERQKIYQAIAVALANRGGGGAFGGRTMGVDRVAGNARKYRSKHDIGTIRDAIDYLVQHEDLVAVGAGARETKQDYTSVAIRERDDVLERLDGEMERYLEGAAGGTKEPKLTAYKSAHRVIHEEKEKHAA